MKTIRSLFLCLISASMVVVVGSAWAAQTRSIQLECQYGIGGVDLDTGYLGVNQSLYRLEVRAHGGFGGKLLDIEMPGDVSLDACAMSVMAAPNAGSLSVDLGFEYGAMAYYGIPDLGIDEEFDLLSLIGLHSLDMRWNESLSFTPFLLDDSVTVVIDEAKDTVLDVDVSQLVLPGVPFVGAGVTLAVDSTLSGTLAGDYIHFSNPNQSIYSEGETVSLCSGTSVLSYEEDASLDLNVGFWPGLFIDVFGLRYEVLPARVGFDVLSAGIPLAFNTQTVTFGSEPNPTGIGLTCNVSPSSVSSGMPVTVSGTATYNGGAGPVASGTVDITVGGSTYTASISGGNYSRSVYAPSFPGSYTVSAQAADGLGRTGDASTSLTVSGGNWSSDWGIDYFYTCADLDHQASFPQEYADDIRGIFAGDDGSVYVYIMFEDVRDEHSIQLKWFRPDGTHYGTINNTIGEDGWIYDNWYYWASYDIAGYNMSDLEGRWKVKLYVDGDYIETKEFTIRYEFKEHRMAEDVDPSDPFDPINPKSIFTQVDLKALTWCLLDNVAEALEVLWRFHEPNGSLYSEFTYLSEDPGAGSWWDWYKLWGWIGISGSSAANKCGNWSVDVFVKDVWGNWDKEYTDHFTIMENPNVPPVVAVNHAPMEVLPAQNVSVTVSASDNTYLQKIELHWNNGTGHSQIWDDLIVPSITMTHSIGGYAEGREIEYWVVVWDTSGNRTESARHHVIVVPDIPTQPDGPIGPQTIAAGQTVTITTGGSTLSQGGAVEYRVDWGDGTFSPWGGPTATHSWPAAGHYPVKVIARSQANPSALSVESDVLLVAVDGAAPIVNILTDGGNGAGNIFTTHLPDVIIEAGVGDPYPASGIAAVSVNTGASNEGTLENPRYQVPLVEGSNVFTVEAVDNVGHTTTTSITIYYVPPTLRLIGAAAGVTVLEFQTFPTANYTVQCTTNLNSSVWADVDSVAGNGGVVRIHHTNQLGQGYYRLKLTPVDSVVATPSGMSLIPAGPFLMGDALGDGGGNELPVHGVSVREFHIDQHEVTRELWNTVVTWAVTNGYDLQLYGESSQAPATSVTWVDAVKFCNARSEMEGVPPTYFTTAARDVVLRSGAIVPSGASVDWESGGYRLPTEAEWEKAARGGISGQRFPWGNLISLDQAAYWSSLAQPYELPPSGLAGIQNVGSYNPNNYQLYDMAGNVWEWVWDWYDANWYATTEASGADPRGPQNGSTKVIRGGSGTDYATHARCSARGQNYAPTSTGANFGFRCARSVMSLIPTTGLVAYYALEGDVSDSSGRGMHGNSTGATFEAGLVGEAVGLDGVDDYITLPSDIVGGLPQGTFTSWINIHSFPRDNAVIASQGEPDCTHFFMSVNPDGALAFGMCGGATGLSNLNGTPRIEVGEWALVTVTWDGTEWHLYVNGALDVSLLTANYPATTSDSFKLGRHEHISGPYMFDGLMDEVRFYSRALCPEEIQRLYAADR